MDSPAIDTQQPVESSGTPQREAECGIVAEHHEGQMPPSGRLVLWSGMPECNRQALRREVAVKCRLFLASVKHGFPEGFSREDVESLRRSSAECLRTLRRSLRAGGWQRSRSGREEQSTIPVPSEGAEDHSCDGQPNVLAGNAQEPNAGLAGSTLVHQLTDLICGESDVKALLRLEPLDGDSFAYAIETTFDTFPSLVVGTTNVDNTRVVHYGFGSSKDCLESLWASMMERFNLGGAE